MKYSILLLTFIVSYLSSVEAQYYHPSCPKRCEPTPECSNYRKCPFGRETGSCNCCSRCLKGEGEVCGGPGNKDGNCAEGYFCDKSQSYPTYTNPSGVCQYAHVICIVPCKQTSCKHVYCKFGTTKDICKCCDVCLKGKGDSCGGFFNDFGKCAHGLYCDESGVVFGESPGVCKVWNILTIQSHHNNYRRYRYYH